MNASHFAYLVLKDAIQSDRGEGEIRRILENKGWRLSEMEIREVGDFITNRGLGKVIPISMGRYLVMTNLSSKQFVVQMNNITFEQKLKLIYSELETLPDKKGELETILNRLGIDPTPHVVSEFVAHFRVTDHVKIVAESKDGYDIVLTQKGQDNLHAPVERSNQPNIVIEDYRHSIVNKGNNITQLGVFESGIKRDNNSATNNPITNPTPSPNPNSPTRKIQRWQLVVAVIGVLTVVALALLKKYGIL